MTVDWTTARWADGPKVAAWIEERIAGVTCYSHRLQRALCRWRAGGSADFYALDAVLAEVGLHPFDLPDDVWTDKKAVAPPYRPRAQGGRKLDAAKIAEIHRLRHEEELTQQQIGDRFGVCRGTVAHVLRGRTYKRVAA